MPGLYSLASAAAAGQRRGNKKAPVPVIVKTLTWFVGRLPAHFSLQQKVELIMLSSRFGNLWDVGQTVASLVSCVFYVLNTYDWVTPFGVDEGLTILFTVDYALRLFASPNRLRYPFGFFPIVDALTCLPVYLGWAANTQVSQLNFMRFVRVLRIMRILRAFKMLNASLSAFTKQLITLVLTVVSLVFLYAGLINLVEDQVYKELQGADPPRLVPFLDAVYYAVVTLATVGYGDIVPLTPIGKFMCCVFIATAIVVVPMQVNGLAEVISLSSRYRKAYHPSAETSHVVLVGNVRDGHMVREFLREFYHEDRMEDADHMGVDCRCVILGLDEPSEEVRKLLSDAQYTDRLQYIRGSAMNADDLERARVDVADAVFIVSDVKSTDARTADNVTTLRALKIQNFAPATRVYVHTLSTEALGRLQTGHDIGEAMCVDEWRARLLAHAAVLPGFATLVTSLIRTMSVQTEAEDTWLSEYSVGAAGEVYALPCPPALDGLSFSDIARAVYDRFGGTMTVWGVREPEVAATSAEGIARFRRIAEQASQRNLLSTVPLRIRGSTQSTKSFAASARGSPTKDRSGSADTPRALSPGAADSASSVPRGEVRVPGRVLFNPGSCYRVKEGQTLYILGQNFDEVDNILAPGTFTQAVDALRESPGPDGKSGPGGWTQPLAGADTEWTWEGNGRAAVERDRTRRQAGALDDAILKETAPVLSMESVKLASPSVYTDSHSPSTQARKLWSEVKGSITSTVASAQVRGTASSAVHTAGGGDSSSVHASILRNRSRRFSASHITTSSGLDLITAAAAGEGFGGEDASRPGVVESPVMGFSVAVQQTMERRRALQSVIIRDVTMLRPVLHRHIIVCGSLRAFCGFLSPLRDSHMSHTALWRHIVLLTSYDDTPVATAAVEDISRFKGVSIVLGSPSNEADLRRAGVCSADSLILLADTGISAAHDARAAMESSDSSGSSAGFEHEPVDPRAQAEALDATVIFRYLVLEQLLSSLQVRPSFYILVELTMLENLQVLNSKRVGKLRMLQDVGARHDRIAAMLTRGIVSVPAPPGTPRGALTSGIKQSSSRAFAFAAGDTPSVVRVGSPAGRGGSVKRAVSFRKAASTRGLPTSSATVRPDVSRLPLTAPLGSRIVVPIIGMGQPASEGATNGVPSSAPLPSPPGAGDNRLARLAQWLTATAGLRSQERGADAPAVGLINTFNLPFFAAGYAFPVDSLHAVLASAYYNKDIVPFAEELMSPSPGRASRLITEPVPRRFHGRPYVELWRAMSERYDAVVVGLYRCNCSKGAPLPYVYTNPLPTTTLLSDDSGEDLMYVLTRRPLFTGPQAVEPRELSGMEEVWGWPGADSTPHAFAARGPSTPVYTPNARAEPTLPLPGTPSTLHFLPGAVVTPDGEGRG